MALHESRLPNLLIAGVNKAGTTSLFTYLAHHPDVCASNIKETFFFSPLRYGEELGPLENYAANFKHCKSQKYALEATPEYFYGCYNTTQAIIERLGKIRIIIIFRDPVERLISFYKQLKGKAVMRKDISIEEYVSYCEKFDFIHAAEKRNAYIYSGIQQGFYADYINDWHEAFGDQLKITFFEDMVYDPHEFMINLCDWLRVDSEPYRTFNFQVENKSRLYKYKAIHKAAIIANRKFEKLFRKHPHLKKPLRHFYYALNEAHMDEEIPEDLISYLEDLYASSNIKLREILFKKGYSDLPRWLTDAKG